MAGDAKYGRLFTEADARLLVKYGHIRGWQACKHGTPAPTGEELLAEFLEADGPMPPEQLTFPGDEPLLLLRGSEMSPLRSGQLAEQALEPYYRALLDWLQGVLDWQRERPVVAVENDG